MDLVKKEIGLLLFVIAICGFCNGFVYKVGDPNGWANIGNLDYNKWASSKSFRVGDTVIFEYDLRFHNVLQVSRSDFHSCDTTAPISAYATGNDSIVIHSSGHYYYICGFVGHCQAGQKVDIRVPNSDPPIAIPISSPIQARNESAVPQASSIPPLAPSPSVSNGQPHMNYDGLFSLDVALLLFVIWAFI